MKIIDKATQSRIQASSDLTTPTGSFDGTKISGIIIVKQEQYDIHDSMNSKFL